MSPAQLQDHFLQLGLTADEAADLLSVSPRTVQRWQHGIQEVPGPAEQTLRAWLGSHERGVAWRPNEVAMDNSEKLAIARVNAVGLEDLLRRVDARGGPAAPWAVDLERCRATLGPLQVTFYKLRDGGFAPQSYRRSDELGTDLQRDWPLIEDAFACIADAFAKQGTPMRTRLAFTGASLDKGKVALWDMSLTPPVVAVISCQVLRDVLRAPRELTDAECRLHVRINLDAVTRLAEELFAEGRASLRDSDVAIRVIEIGAADLKSLSERFFFLGNLDTKLSWAWR